MAPLPTTLINLIDHPTVSFLYSQVWPGRRSLHAPYLAFNERMLQIPNFYVVPRHMDFRHLVAVVSVW